MTEDASHSHRTFGLGVRSPLPLPELKQVEGDAPTDIEIVYGDVPEELPGIVKRGLRFQVASDALRLQVDGIATFLAIEGRRIVIQRAAGADEADVRTFLLGSVLGAVLHQRGDLVLSASAVVHEGRAVLFVGRSGTGKSTLAVALARRGCRVLTDGICALRREGDGRVTAASGFPQIKLWLDALQQLGIAPDRLPKVRRGIEKRALPCRETFATEPAVVRRLYVLRPQNRAEATLEPLNAMATLALVTNAARGCVFPVNFPTAAQQATALKLAQQATTSVVHRGGDLARLDELADAIMEDLRR